jgi:hypothetical protein
MQTTLILPTRPHLQHIAHIHHIRISIWLDINPDFVFVVPDLQAARLVLEQERDGAEIGVCACT